MSSARFLSSSWPPSCLQLPSRRSGASGFDFLACLPLRWSRPTSFPRPALFSPSCGVLSKLRRMEPGAPAARYSQLLDCLCSWGQAASILELITDWLTQALPKQGVSRAESPPGRLQPGLKLRAFLCCLSTLRRWRAAAGRCVSRRRWRPNQSWPWLTWSTCSTTRPRGRRSWPSGRHV